MEKPYDTAWKMMIDAYFEAFMAFFFPAAHRLIDWSKPVSFMEQELLAVQPESKTGRRYVDKLAAVHLKADPLNSVLVHIEIQTGWDRELPRRVFSYNTRIFDHLNKDVTSFVVLDDFLFASRSNYFSYGMLGGAVKLQFNMVGLQELVEDIDHLEWHANPFALAVKCHLKSRQTIHNPHARFDWKLRMMLLLKQHRSDERGVFALDRFVAWTMKLPATLEVLLKKELKAMEKYVLENGLPMGLLEILAREYERERGMVTLIIDAAKARFNTLPDWFYQKIRAGEEEELRGWHLALLNAETLDEIFQPKQNPSAG